MYIFSIGPIPIPPDLCIFFQSAQSQSNPIFGCCFSRANPNPTRFMYIFSIGPTLIQSDLCTFFQSAYFFNRPNPNPTRFLDAVSVGPTLIQPDLCTFFQSAQSQSHPIYAYFFNRPNPNPTRFLDAVSVGPTLIHPDSILIFPIGPFGQVLPETFMNSPTRPKKPTPIIILGMYQLIRQRQATSWASAESAGPMYNGTLCHFAFRS
jgi:hypothetical protein